jgi:hypothetical protein
MKMICNQHEACNAPCLHRTPHKEDPSCANDDCLSMMTKNVHCVAITEVDSNAIQNM